MAYTTGALTTRVQQRVRDTGYPSSEIRDYLNDTQNDIFNEYRLRFMETTQDYTLTVGVADITNGVGLPTNFVQAIDLMLTTTGYESVIPNIDPSTVDSMYPDYENSTLHPNNTPSAWYMYGSTIKVYPEPNIAYTATLRYYKKPTELTADADIPEVPSQFAELLILGAAYRVLQVKDNYDQAAILQNKYDELLQKLVVRYSQDQIGRPTIMRINRRAVGSKIF